MRNFSEMAFVKVLLVALVVVFVGGLIGAGGALASADLRAFGGGGVEGDPGDGLDVESGGSGEYILSDETASDSNTDLSNNCIIIFTLDYWNFQSDFFLIPVFENGRVVWFLTFASSKWEGK